MNNIVICIPTYKRQAMLQKLILSISESKFDRSLINDVDIVIVDNDADKTAEVTINELKANPLNVHKLHYYSYPVKGISNARNELINKALLFDPNFLVFVDDDEYVTPEWLNELVKTIINNNADAARGPVFPDIDDSIPDSISIWFNRKMYANNTQIDSLVTNNLILDCVSLKKFDVWFDSRFNIIGSGDNYFGIQILKKGAKIFWAAKAVVHETIPAKRANLKWLLKRIYRGASTYTYVLKLEREYVQLVIKILLSLVYIILGICALIIVILPIKRRYWGVRKVTEGIGGLAGLGNLLYKEYK
jgi:succinoglycan biosynthesis protein ExoM